MGLENVKVLYARSPGGVQVTIPLIRAGAYDVADISQRLKTAGIPDDQLPYIVWSSDPTPPKPLNQGSALGQSMAAAAVPGVSKAASDAPPTIPEPTAPNLNPPMLSDLGPLTSVAVTPMWRQLTGCKYSMKRADNNGYVDMGSLGEGDFQDPDDFAKFRDGRVKLCYGLIWRQPENCIQFLKQGGSWSQKIVTKHGMSSTTSVSITASVGYSGYGASVSISATYGYSITVDDETEVTTQVDVAGVAKISTTVVLWELCRLYVVEVDGVVRREDNPFKVIFKDKGGPHELHDTWGPTYEPISRVASVKQTLFPPGPGH